MRPHKNPYEREIEQAKHNHKDFLERLGGDCSPIGDTWESIRARLFTPEEIAASDKRVQRILKKVDEREAREVHALAKAPVGTHRPQREAHA